eukprot:COSAG01_NODE_48916_length_376_cov_9.317690_1_plen_59_part_01
MEQSLEQPPYFEQKRRIIRACGHVSCPPPLLDMLIQGRRCKKQRAGIITSASSSASCPS